MCPDTHQDLCPRVSVTLEKSTFSAAFCARHVGVTGPLGRGRRAGSFIDAAFLLCGVPRCQHRVFKVPSLDLPWRGADGVGG